MKDNFVVLFNTADLIPNPTKLTIYQEPENFSSIRENIKNQGIIEPLIVNAKTNIIISGNLRYQIALELGIHEVPVIFEDIEDVEMDITSISTNQTRVKSYSEILKEIEAGTTTHEDIGILEENCDVIYPNSFCAFAPGAIDPVKSMLRLFRDEVEEHIKLKACPMKYQRPL